MKKVFFIALTTFFISGIILFYLVDKNSDIIKEKVKDKFGNIQEHTEIIIGNKNEELENIEKEFNQNYRKIEANVNVGELRIVSYEGTSIKIKSLIPKKSLNDFFVEEKEERIIIKANIAHEIIVQVPKDMILEGQIKMGVGDFYGENLKNLYIELNTGNIKGKNLNGVKKIKLDLGDFDISSSKNIEIIEMKTGSGKLEIVEQNNDFSISNNLGDLEIKITNKFDGEINSKVKLGNTKINNLNTKGKKYKGNINLDLGELTIGGIN